jgi:para-nitrobenzyl esterase
MTTSKDTTSTTTATAATADGRVQGLREHGVASFLGVPFAAPPVGDLRFRPPQPHDPWDGVRDCTRPGPTAPQPVLPDGLMPQTIVEGDGILHLNVHTPALQGSLPVFVWIHGGGMVMGGNADVDGRALARRGLVVVAANYRLGCDGFLCLDGAPPNRAVLDWIAALQWVQANIGLFGGDAANVTIGGQSAGSAACLTLLAVPRSDGLFRRVLAMSGVPWNLADLDTARAKAGELAGRVDAPPTVAGVGAVPIDRLLAVQSEMAPIAGIGTSSDPVELFHNIATLEGWRGGWGR